MAEQKDPHFAVADAAEVARAREDFLSSGSSAVPDVSRTILASWQRSRENQIDVDRVDVPYSRDWDCQTPLLASARPVLESLQQQLHDEPVSMILTDKQGLVLDRRVTHQDLLARLDAVSLAPGFSYAEQFVGTNGIGTTIISGRAVLVDGRAHYTEQLGQFACAGVPIRHPTRRTTLGVLDLTSWAVQAPGAMLMALAKATAREIEEELLAHTGMRELALFQEYMKTCQQSGGPVLAVNADALMMNDHLRLVLGSDEQQTLTDYAVEMLRANDHAGARTIQLPSGRTAQLRCVPVGSDAGNAGAVFRIRLLQGETHPAPVRTVVRGIRSSITPPGLAGTSPAWTRCVQQVDSCYEAGEWLALTGEPGSGKRSLLRAIHLLHNPTHSFRLLQPPGRGELDSWLSALSDALSTTAGLVVVAHCDKLDERARAALADQVLNLACDDDPSRHVWVAITTSTAQAPAAELATAFPRTIEVPPLRHHIDDLRELVSFLLRRLVGETGLSISEPALAQLSRLSWPGNIAQLRDVLAQVAKRRHSGIIEVADLPPEARTSAHRRLTPIEALERDAIVQALLDNAQKPTEAAAVLGISRATIYRKLHQYGISLPIVR